MIAAMNIINLYNVVMCSLVIIILGLLAYAVLIVVVGTLKDAIQTLKE